MTISMSEEQATHIPGAGQDQEPQNKRNSGRDSQVMTKSLLKW